MLTRTVLAIIAVSLIVSVATTAAAQGPPLAYLATGLSAAGTALSLSRPIPGLVLVAAAAPVAVLAGTESTGFWSIACFAVFIVVLRGCSPLAGGVIVTVSNFASAAWGVGTVDVNVNASASVAAFAALVATAGASAIRGNLRYRQVADARLRDAEASRTTAVQRGVAEERLRIARELHDSVGHEVAVASMHLGAAEVALPGDAERSLEHLRATRASLQAVLAETQHILAILRVGDEQHAPGRAPRSLDDLVAASREAGMDIDWRVEGDATPLAPESAAALYRIVQEGLTNAAKHGRGTISLAVGYAPDGVEVQLVNVRAAPGGPGGAGLGVPGGKGLVGLQERAQSVGGTLRTRADERLFWLTATVPPDPRRPPDAAHDPTAPRPTKETP
ncbi:histidine kinase [Mycetocola reblochoni]|uniref:histidine kinase n=1 Tax=Mycetocola reblochoni TaxID=331618 RepID=A0A3L6ZU78_9MICO|nr:histidine kinase [Mycetocola reblochoni]